jgi:predicted amidohydrolase
MTGLYILSIVVILISALLVINTPVSQFFDNMKAKRQAKKLARQEEAAALAAAGAASAAHAAAGVQPAPEPPAREVLKIIPDQGKLITGHDKLHTFENKEYKRNTIELPVLEPVYEKTG